MDFSDYFINRATCRRFSSREVTDELLSSLVAMASHAPTTGNMQVCTVIVTRDPEARKELAAAHFNQPAATGAPVLMTFCADFNRMTQWCRASDADAGYDNFQGFITALLDTVAFAQQFNTAAEMHGLGCCYLGTTTYTAPRIGELLKLPRLVVPATTIAVGWPEGDSAEVGRLPLEAVMHYEHYNNVDDDAVRALYAEKEARSDSRGFVAENSKDNLAQVFTDVRYPRAMMEEFSDVYRNYIEAQGFQLGEIRKKC